MLGSVQAAYLGLQPSRRCPLNAKEGKLDWGLTCIKQDGERQDTWVSQKEHLLRCCPVHFTGTVWQFLVRVFEKNSWKLYKFEYIYEFFVL